MVRFLARRLGMALGILALLSVIMYLLLDVAIDPLEELRTDPSPNRDQKIANRIALLDLDKPVWIRYLNWLGRFVQGDFGLAWRSMTPVNHLLTTAIPTSIQLVFASTVIAILLGVTIGVLSALRQYTPFDYAITFVAFLLYSLPIFWVAVLLKQFLAIGLNDYINDPSVNWALVVGLSLLSGLFWLGALGGTVKRRLITFALAFAATFGVLAYALGSGWVQHPRIGVVGVGAVAFATAFAVSALFAGLNNRRALGAAFTTAAFGVLAWFGCQWLFFYVPMNELRLLGLLVAAVLVSLLIGWLWGGPDRAVSMRGAAIVAVATSVMVFIDRVFQGWEQYSASGLIRGRPIATIGAATPGLNGDFWIAQLDKFTHLLLPTIALVMISFASYTRYQRGATLEVLNQDYIRTARAKGLPERLVIVRHALRNALMPLASIVPVDFVAMVGGAVVTETIFSWAGMGSLFVRSLLQGEVDPVMVYVMIVGGLAMVANLIADFLYAVIDPRIRVNA
nr:ABC transporter permease [Propionibacterium sp.]